MEQHQFDINQIDEYRKKHNTSVLAIMFTDIEGFTAYTNREGDVAASQMLELHDKVALKAIEDNDGIAIKKIGDSFLAIFADPSLSVKCALFIQQELKKQNFPLKVRIGIHLGQVALVQNLSADIFGNHVNIASRVESLAKGGQIFLSRTVYDNVHSWVRSEYIKYKYHGKAKLKGIEGKEDVYQVGMAGDDFTGVESIKREKRNNIIKVSATVVVLIAVSISVSFSLIRKEKRDLKKSNRKILFEMWSSDLNHSIPIWEGLGFMEEDSEGMIYSNSSPDSIEYSLQKSFKTLLDTVSIEELDDSTIKKMFFDFKIQVLNTYDNKEVSNRFVFEDDLIEKGFLDTFDIGENIPLHILQSIGCDQFFFCELFRSRNPEDFHYFLGFTPHQLITPPTTIASYFIKSGKVPSVKDLTEKIFEIIERVGERRLPVGNIISINENICYIKNEYKIGKKFIGKYLYKIERVIFLDGGGTISFYLPYILEVKSVSDSLITTQIIQDQSTNDETTIRNGDYIIVDIKDIYSYDPEEICQHWYWYADEVGRSLISQSKYQEALKIYGDKYRKVLEKKNDNLWQFHMINPLSSYAENWALAGKNLKSALKAAKKSLEIKETDDAWDALSIVYWKMGKYQEALEAEENALKLTVDYSEKYKMHIQEEYNKRISDIKAKMVKEK